MFPRKILVDHTGSYRTQSLFLETNKSRLTPIMTLKEVDWEWHGVVLPSLKRMYMECADPTEFAVAKLVLNSWPHWQRLLDNKLVRTEILKWRDELEVMLRAEGIKSLRESAKLEGGKGIGAAKYLADRGWDKRQAGAPSREEKVRQAKIYSGIKSELEDDGKRIGITH